MEIDKGERLLTNSIIKKDLLCSQFVVIEQRIFFLCVPDLLLIQGIFLNVQALHTHSTDNISFSGR